MVLIAPIGIPEGTRMASHSSYVFVTKTSCSVVNSEDRLTLRAALVEYRGSAVRLSSPMDEQSALHSLSLGIPRARSRVLVRNVWYGKSVGYTLPEGLGTIASAKYAPITF